MDINPPFGYKEIVPLTKAHRVAVPADGRLPEVFRSQMVLPLSYSEISLACHDYPLVFVSGDQGKSVAAMALVRNSDGRGCGCGMEGLPGIEMQCGSPGQLGGRRRFSRTAGRDAS